jgi:hypothetical protein
VPFPDADKDHTAPATPARFHSRRMLRVGRIAMLYLLTTRTAGVREIFYTSTARSFIL